MAVTAAVPRGFLRFAKRLGKRPVTSALHCAGFYAWRLEGLQSRSGSALILTYHRVNGQREHERRDDTAFENGISARRFDGHMRFLRERLRPMPLAEIAERIHQGRPLPTGAVAVTFDDGYRDNYTAAYPVLTRHRVPATVFVVTDLVGTSRRSWWDTVSELVKRTRNPHLDVSRLRSRPAGSPPRGPWPLVTRRQKEDAIEGLCATGRSLGPDEVREFLATLREECGVSEPELASDGLMMTWEQARAMSGTLVSIESHTHTHPNIARLGQKQAKDELTASKEIIEAEVRQPVRGFAYPFGEGHPDQDWLRATARGLGYTYACVLGHHAVPGDADPFRLARIAVPNVGLPLLLREMIAALRATAGAVGRGR